MLRCGMIDFIWLAVVPNHRIGRKRSQSPPTLRILDASIGKYAHLVVEMNPEIKALQNALREFARQREWDQFHSPKNLAAALSVESAELLEHFQWLTDEQSHNFSDDKRAKVAEELADVMLYALQLADKLDIDLIAAAWKKLEINGEKYPVDRSKGRSNKYTEL